MSHGRRGRGGAASGVGGGGGGHDDEGVWPATSYMQDPGMDMNLDMGLGLDVGVGVGVDLSPPLPVHPMSMAAYPHHQPGLAMMPHHGHHSAGPGGGGGGLETLQQPRLSSSAASGPASASASVSAPAPALAQPHYQPQQQHFSQPQGHPYGHFSVSSTLTGSNPTTAPSTAAPATTSTTVPGLSSGIMPSSATSSGPASDPDTSASGGSTSGRPIRRRMRMITSCLECRRRKLKCDKSHPCTNCVRFRRDCLYLGPKLDEAGQLRLTQIKEKVGSLERQLEQDVVRGGSGDNTPSQQQRILADEVEGQYADTQGLRPTEMAGLDHTYDDTVDETDEVIDLGVMVGRMRITDRIAGFSRPRVAEELSAGMPPESPAGPQPPMSSQPPPSFDFTMGTSDPAWPDYLRPGSTYIAPPSGLLMGQPGALPSLETLLPTRGAADRLIQQYFDAVHPIVRCVHQPSFEAGYHEFWSHVAENIEPRPSLQALVFAAMFSGAVSMEDETARREFGKTQHDLHETLKLGTETALSKANFLRTTRVETLQAFVMYLLPLCRDELSRAHSVLVGAAIRMAECMGLHRDGETYGLDPLETHVRRLVWHQLCALDIRTCEAHGPRPAIRRDDYDTRLPLNVDDDQLRRDGPAPVAPEHWTSMMWPLMRFEINEMMRVVWLDRRRVDAHTMTLTEALAKIENFRRAMLAKYNHHLRDDVPLQRYARMVMHLFLCRLRVMTLHVYRFTSTGPQLPPRLATVLIASGIMVCEIGIQLETNPLFRLWRWYSGAYHQFQTGLMLAAEVHFRPATPEADRIWACLDYVFGLDPTLQPSTKGLMLLREIVDKVTAYQRMRKARAPTSLAQAVPSREALFGKPDAETQQPHGVSMGHHPPPPMTMQSSAAGSSYMTMPDTQQQPQPAWNMPQPKVNNDPSRPGGETDPVGTAPQGMMGMMSDADTRPLIGVDWDVINTLFTQDPTTGELNIPGYDDPMLTMPWQP